MKAELYSQMKNSTPSLPIQRIENVYQNTKIVSYGELTTCDPHSTLVPKMNEGDLTSTFITVYTGTGPPIETNTEEPRTPVNEQKQREREKCSPKCLDPSTLPTQKPKSLRAGVHNQQNKKTLEPPKLSLYQPLQSINQTSRWAWGSLRSVLEQ